MKTSKFPRLPIKAAADVVKSYDQDQAIVVSFHRDSGTTQVATFGRTLRDKAESATGGNVIKNALAFPAEKCMAVPAILVRKAQPQLQWTTNKEKEKHHLYVGKSLAALVWVRGCLAQPKVKMFIGPKAMGWHIVGNLNDAKLFAEKELNEWLRSANLV